MAKRNHRSNKGKRKRRDREEAEAKKRSTEVEAKKSKKKAESSSESEEESPKKHKRRNDSGSKSRKKRAETSDSESVQGEDIWHHKYSNWVSMIPRFLSLPIAPGATSALSKASPSDLELVRELLFVFQVILSDTSVRFSSCYIQGIEGSLIRYDEGKFSLSKKMSLPSHQRCAVLKLCEVGWLYRQVHSFTEAKSADQSYGLVGHSFVTALREELTEYYR